MKSVIWQPDLNAEAQHWQAIATELADGPLIAQAERHDREQSYPMANVALMTEQGLSSLLLPRAFGGHGASMQAGAAVVEAIATGCPSSAAILCTEQLGVYPLLLAGSQAQKEYYLPEAVRGAGFSFALSERISGSDPAATQTRATAEGDGWRIVGEKYWIGNGGVSRYYLVFAKTAPSTGRGGLGAFILDRETKGVEIDEFADKMGMRGTKTSNLRLDTHITDQQRIGPRDGGLKLALKTLSIGRLLVAAQSMGLAIACYRAATERAMTRQTFGRPIIDHQAIAFRLADIATRISAGRMMLYQAASSYDRGEDVSTIAAMAKLYCSEIAHEAANGAVQIFGGLGFCKPSLVERLYRDQRVLELYEGTSEIQRIVIARAIRKASSLDSAAPTFVSSEPR